MPQIQLPLKAPAALIHRFDFFFLIISVKNAERRCTISCRMSANDDAQANWQK